MPRHLRFITILVSSLLLLAGADVVAQNLTQSQNRKAQLEKELAQLDRQIKENASLSSNAMNELTLVRRRIEARKELIDESDREIAGIDGNIRATQKSIDSLQVKLDTMTFYYERLVKNAYKNRDARIWYMHILAAENLGQGLRRYSFLRSLSQQMNVQAEKILESKAELDSKKTQLQSLRAQAALVRSQQQEEMNKLREEEKTSKSLVDRLQRDKRKYQRDIETKRKEVEKLNKEIQRLIAESMGTSTKKGSTTAKKKVEVDYTLSKKFSENKGKLPWPVDGPVVERFGVHYHPVYTQLKLPPNDGITISVDKGTQVKCVFDGVVKNVIVMQGYNKCVLVQHGEYFTFYCKLGDVSVKAGDKVKTGQVLGTIEPLGGVSQLHFQIWKTNPVDPMPWLRPR
ncbi:MAG: peptidoglycan DD-metalloendopeptidase family protein [Bacteroidales bacterium]|nr:peptidoglycan DD-metalloendopeptidase family protein [Bacteroidales bacterium]